MTVQTKKIYQCDAGRPDKRYRTNPSAIAKIAARPAAIAAHALHWLCLYTKRTRNLGSSRPVSTPRFARRGFRNLTRADMNQRKAAAAAKVSERTSSAVFMRVSRTGVAQGQQNPKSGICSSCLPRSPNGKQENGERSRAEDDGGDPGNFDVENPSRIKCHAPLFAAAGRQH
jgi:hypothetical protein